MLLPAIGGARRPIPIPAPVDFDHFQWIAGTKPHSSPPDALFTERMTAAAGTFHDRPRELFPLTHRGQRSAGHRGDAILASSAGCRARAVSRRLVPQLPSSSERAARNSSDAARAFVKEEAAARGGFLMHSKTGIRLATSAVVTAFAATALARTAIRQAHVFHIQRSGGRSRSDAARWQVHVPTRRYQQQERRAGAER